MGSEDQFSWWGNSTSAKAKTLSKLHFFSKLPGQVGGYGFVQAFNWNYQGNTVLRCPSHHRVGLSKVKYSYIVSLVFKVQEIGWWHPSKLPDSGHANWKIYFPIYQMGFLALPT